MEYVGSEEQKRLEKTMVALVELQFFFEAHGYKAAGDRVYEARVAVTAAENSVRRKLEKQR